MSMASRMLLGIALLLITGCEQNSNQPYTLYRNSPLDSNHRDHFASFNTKNKNNYNRDNCIMTSKLLNANIAASAKVANKKPYPHVGFWCEAGDYNVDGSIPDNFESSYPASSNSPMSWN